MLKIVNFEALVLAGRGTRFGPGWRGKRCLAKNRKGGRCQNPAMKNRERCRLHGGLSSGAKTIEGKARVVAANWRHGHRAKGRTEKVKQIRAELRQIIYALKRAGFIF